MTHTESNSNIELNEQLIKQRTEEAISSLAERLQCSEEQIEIIAYPTQHYPRAWKRTTKHLKDIQQSFTLANDAACHPAKEGKLDPYYARGMLRYQDLFFSLNVHPTGYDLRYVYSRYGNVTGYSFVRSQFSLDTFLYEEMKAQQTPSSPLLAATQTWLPRVVGFSSSAAIFISEMHNQQIWDGPLLADGLTAGILLLVLSIPLWVISALLTVSARRLLRFFNKSTAFDARPSSADAQYAFYDSLQKRREHYSKRRKMSRSELKEIGSSLAKARISELTGLSETQIKILKSSVRRHSFFNPMDDQRQVTMHLQAKELLFTVTYTPMDDKYIPDGLYVAYNPQRFIGTEKQPLVPIKNQEELAAALKAEEEMAAQLPVSEGFNASYHLFPKLLAVFALPFLLYAFWPYLSSGDPLSALTASTIIYILFHLIHNGSQYGIKQWAQRTDSTSVADMLQQEQTQREELRLTPSLPQQIKDCIDWDDDKGERTAEA